MIGKARLLSDNSARVSFAVIGIFLIIGSSATSVYIGMNETRIFSEKTWLNTDQRIERIISAARSDFAQIINSAGINAMQYISSHPIITPSSRFDSAKEANEHRLKQEIAEIITRYGYCNYMQNECQQGNLGLCIDFSKLPNQYFSADDIILTEIPMTVHRSVTFPVFGPKEKESFPTYYEVSCHIPIKILDFKNQNPSIVLTINLSVSTVLTTRFLLMENMITTFEESLQNFGPFWKTFTLLANIYSLARGYRHYQSGKPENIVDNTHLEFMVNLVFLFQEGLFFSGVDPEFFIDSIIKSKNVFSSNPNMHQLSVTNSQPSSDWSIPFSFVQQVEDPIDKLEKDFSFQAINFSEIIYSILWNVTNYKLLFKDEQGKKQAVYFDVTGPDKSLDDFVHSYIENDWQLVNTIKHKKKRNQTTQNMIQSIIKSVYSTSFSTTINKDGPTTVINGDHHDFNRDNGSGEWIFHQAKLVSSSDKPDKGLISIESTVHSETYDIIWKRSHDYSRKIVEEIDNETIQYWQDFTTIDTKIEHNVTLSIMLQNFGNNDITPEEIKDVCYKNDEYDDSNLNSVISIYKESYFDKNKNEFFTASEGTYLTKTVYEKTSLGLITIVFNELITMYEDTSSIDLSDHIYSMDYPHPKSLIRISIQKYLQQFQNNASSYLSKQEFLDNHSFICAQLKAVYAAKKWFIETIGEELPRYKDKVLEKIDLSLENALDEANIGNKHQFDESMNEDIISSLHRQIKVPFSLPMKLHSRKAEDEVDWNESIVYAIDHEPGYCSCFEQENIDGKYEFFLGIRNNCLLGSTGLPILPITPTTPWLITLNLWLIQIRGEFAVFSISDSLDETIFHPFFCHEPLEYVRTNEIIRADDGTILGWNERISYAIDTISTAVVPSGGCMVGDTNGILSEHHGKAIS